MSNLTTSDQCEGWKSSFVMLNLRLLHVIVFWERSSCWKNLSRSFVVKYRQRTRELPSTCVVEYTCHYAPPERGARLARGDYWLIALHNNCWLWIVSVIHNGQWLWSAKTLEFRSATVVSWLQTGKWQLALASGTAAEGQAAAACY